jgi:hypothetical protein
MNFYNLFVCVCNVLNLFCNARIREAALSTKKEGQGEKEGSKATEDISDDDEKEDNWDEDMEKVCKHVEVLSYHLPNYYCTSSVHIDVTSEESLFFTLTTRADCAAVRFTVIKHVSVRYQNLKLQETKGGFFQFKCKLNDPQQTPPMFTELQLFVNMPE